MKKLLLLFWEFFKISLFVLGGGYAIIVVADQVFGKRLKWLREGELLENLPLFQMVPGLIAGNSAIYVGLKTAGRLGAVVALAAAALPSFLIFLCVSCGYSALPTENPWVSGALLGLRSAVTGLVFATLAKGWRKSVVGIYGYSVFAAAAALMTVFGMNAALVLVAAMSAGVVWKFCGGSLPLHETESAGVELAPWSPRKRLAAAALFACAIAAVSFFEGRTFWTFMKFGSLGFGGGYALVPLYMHEFVGSAAPQLNILPDEFANLIALTQTTPGPVSINAATYFGFRSDGIAGAAAATVGILLPSLILLTGVLTGLAHWKKSRVVQGILGGVRPATCALILNAGVAFAGMSVFTRTQGSACAHARGVAFAGMNVFAGTDGSVFAFHPFPALIAVFAGLMLLKGRLSVMTTIFICALLGSLTGVIAR